MNHFAADLRCALFGMGAEQDFPKRRYALMIAGLYLVLTAAATAWLFDTRNQPLLVDNQHYFYIAERAASGSPPHVSNFDPKHHASSLLSAAGIAAGRLFGLQDVLSTRLVSLLAVSVSVGAIWLLVLAVTRSAVAGHLSATCMFSFSMLFWHASMGARPKVFLVAFMILTLLALAHRRAAWVGVFGVLSYLCWQPGLLVLCGGVLALLFLPQRGRNMAWLCVGILATVAAYQSYYALYGLDTLRVQWFQTFVFPGEYMAHQRGGWAGFVPAGEKLAQSWKSSFTRANHVAIGFLLLSCISLILSLVRPRAVARYLNQHPFWICYSLCALVSTLFTFYDHQGPPDLFFVVPFLAIGFGVGAWNAVRWIAGARVRVLAAPLALGCVAWSVYAGVQGARVRHRADVGLEFTLKDQYALSRSVARIVERGQSVLAVRCTHLMGMSRLENHVNYGFVFPGLQDYLTQRGTVDFDPKRDGRWPDVIFASRLRSKSAVFDWIRRNYRPIRNPDALKQNIRMFVRRAARAGG